MPPQNTTTVLIPVVQAISDTRSVWDIIRGCLTTLFVCTWVSIHPNMPSLNSTRTKTMLRRVELVLWGVICPEMILFWAFMQWLGARALALEHKGWTITHGFFLQMGGFVLVEDGKRTEVLWPSRFQELCRERKIELPTVTEEEILNRSSADALSKALVIFQVIWFIIQCIGRWKEALYITNLEITTLAYASLTGSMYFLWWKKPMDARIPVEVNCSSRDWETMTMTTVSDTPFTSNHVILIQLPPENMFKRTVFFIFRRLREMKNNCIYVEEDQDITQHVPPFLWYKMDISIWHTNVLILTSFRDHVLLVLAAGIFGGIHCVAWFSDFPTRIESDIWKVASGIVTGAPFIYFIPVFVSFILNGLLIKRRIHHRFSSISQYPLYAVKVLSCIIPPLYISARIVLLVEALISLRSLPETAYTVLSWTVYIPHV